MYSIVNQGVKREYSWATRPMSNEEWRWKAPDLSIRYYCPSKCLDKNRLSKNFGNIFSFEKAENAGIAAVLASIFNAIKRKKKPKFC